MTTPDTKLSGVDPMKVIAENKQLGRSVITEVMALGSSYEDAVRDFGSMMAPAQIPDESRSNGQWYLPHKLKTSAQYDSFWSALDYFYFDVNHSSGGTGNGNEFVDWDPYQSQSVGACYTDTFSVSYKGFGGSTSATICPDRISPRFFTHGYGVRWDGLSSYWKGVAGMGSVSSPPGAPVSRSVSLYMHWSIK